MQQLQVLVKLQTGFPSIIRFITTHFSFRNRCQKANKKIQQEWFSFPERTSHWINSYRQVGDASLTKYHFKLVSINRIWAVWFRPEDLNSSVVVEACTRLLFTKTGFVFGIICLKAVASGCRIFLSQSTFVEILRSAIVVGMFACGCMCICNNSQINVWLYCKEFHCVWSLRPVSKQENVTIKSLS